MGTEANDSDIPESGATFTFGKSKFAENTPNKFWIRNDCVVQVSCGDEHTVLVAESGRVFAFGDNSFGQLGLGHTKSQTKPTCIKALKEKREKAKLVACGRSHTLVYTESNKLYSFGANGDGQLGQGHEEDRCELPTLVEGFDERIEALAAGNQHSLALTEKWEIFVWGSNSDGQLGLKDEDDIVSVPTLLRVRGRVTSIAAGYYHTAFVSDNGKLFTMGEGDDTGKLGREDNSGDEPGRVSLPSKALDVACGGSHTAVVTEKGELFTFGRGPQGQLGLGTTSLQTTEPVLVTSLKNARATTVSCGENHTAVITDKGRLYTFGDGRHGKLAQGEENYSNLFRPFKVSRFRNFFVSSAACGGCHLIVLAKANPDYDSDDEEDMNPLDSTFANSLRMSIDEDLGGTARLRRRKEASPTPMSRTLPPLNSSKGSQLSDNPLSRGTLPQIHKDEAAGDKLSNGLKKSKKVSVEEDDDDDDDDEDDDDDSVVSVTPEEEDSEQESKLNQTLKMPAKSKKSTISAKESLQKSDKKVAPVNPVAAPRQLPKLKPLQKLKVDKKMESDEDDDGIDDDDEEEDSEEERRDSRKKGKDKESAKLDLLKPPPLWNKKSKESKKPKKIMDEDDEDGDESEPEDRTSSKTETEKTAKSSQPEETKPEEGKKLGVRRGFFNFFRRKSPDETATPTDDKSKDGKSKGESKVSDSTEDVGSKNANTNQNSEQKTSSRSCVIL